MYVLKIVSAERREIRVAFDEYDAARDAQVILESHGNIESCSLVIPMDTNNAAAEFHRQRGCCDGSDLRACWEARNREHEEHMKRKRELREREKRARSNPFSEYEGTE